MSPKIEMFSLINNTFQKIRTSLIIGMYQ
jgi:hypothetical protein